MPDKKKKNSFMDTVRRVNERERKAEIEQAAQETKRLAEHERLRREEYGKKLEKDRIELLKIKSGVLDESALPKEEKTVKEYSLKERIGNFIYHNKGYMLAGAFILIIAVFFVYDMARQVYPDVTVMIIATDGEFYYHTEKMTEVFEAYCKDYNDDGEVKVRVAYLPAVPDEASSSDYYYTQANQTKLIAEFQSEDSIIVIGDEKAVGTLGINEGVLADMRFVFRDDENSGIYGYMLKGTGFAEDAGYPGMADDLFIGFREPRDVPGVNYERFKRNYDNAVELWTNYLNKNIQNQPAAG